MTKLFLISLLCVQLARGGPFGTKPEGWVPPEQLPSQGSPPTPKTSPTPPPSKDQPMPGLGDTFSWMTPPPQKASVNSPASGGWKPTMPDIATASSADPKNETDPNALPLPIPPPIAFCPPCPCMHMNPPQWLTPFEPSFQPWHRSRRSVDDDYWHSTGPPNKLLSAINIGYATQEMLRKQLEEYAPPLHVGTISEADFNYPSDFKYFDEEGYKATSIRDNIVYELVGPLEVSFQGSLVGPISSQTDSLTKLIIQSGYYRLTEVQKNGIMKIVNLQNGVTYVVDCNKQRYGGCANLKQIRDPWNFPRFKPIVSKKYILQGYLEGVKTPTGQKEFLTTGIFQVVSVMTDALFSIMNTASNVVYLINCDSQTVGNCQNLKAI